MFEGREEGLKGQTLCCEHGRGRSDRNATDIREIAEFLGRTYTDDGDVRLAIESGTNPTIPMPVACTEGDPTAIQLILQTETKSLIARGRRYQANCRNPPPPIYGQCTEYLHAKLEYLDGWASIKGKLSMLVLLLEIKKKGNKHDKTQHPELGVHDALKGIYIIRQGP